VYKSRVCGIDMAQARKVPTQVSTGADTCGRINRGCDWDMRPATRGIFLLDWWFYASSELADAFGRIWYDFENNTAALKRELVTAEKVRGASEQASPMAGVWIFGHLYWGWHIFKTLRAPVSWAPLTQGQHVLARTASTSPQKCYPTAAQLEYGAASARYASAAPTPLKLPPTFELANPASNRAQRGGRRAGAQGRLDEAPRRVNYSMAAEHFDAGGPPLARACTHAALSIDRSFKCPGASIACEGTEGVDALSAAAAAGRYLETTKDWSRVVKGCAAYGLRGASLGGAPCAEGLKALWACVRAVTNVSTSNCTSLLVKRGRANAFRAPEIVDQARLAEARHQAESRRAWSTRPS
jgi:hypothetical protein